MSRIRPARKGLRTELFVGNLPPHLPPKEQESQLRGVFGRFGPLEECCVLCEDDGSSRGFGFVRLQHGAELAKSTLDNTVIGGGGLPIKVRWALDTHTLCVCDLGPDVNQETVHEAFQQFGTVVSSWLDMDPPELGGGSRCRAFVEYSKKSTAAKVQQLLSHNLFLLGNSPRPVRVEFAIDDAIDDNEGASVVEDARGVVEPPPHFAQPGTLEFDFALKWRELQLAHKAENDQLAELHRQEREVLRHEQRQVYRKERRKMEVIERDLLPELSGPFDRQSFTASQRASYGASTAHMPPQAGQPPKRSRF